MKTYLWLDDIRDPHSKMWQSEFMSDLNSEIDTIVWVKSHSEFTNYIQENGLPDKIFFDHDLGDDEDGSGHDSAKWLVGYCMDHGCLQTPDWDIQSANPVGRDNINGLLSNYKDFLFYGEC